MHLHVFDKLQMHIRLLVEWDEVVSLTPILARKVLFLGWVGGGGGIHSEGDQSEIEVVLGLRGGLFGLKRHRSQIRNCSGRLHGMAIKAAVFKITLSAKLLSIYLNLPFGCTRVHDKQHSLSNISVLQMHEAVVVDEHASGQQFPSLVKLSFSTSCEPRKRRQKSKHSTEKENKLPFSVTGEERTGIRVSVVSAGTIEKGQIKGSVRFDAIDEKVVPDKTDVTFSVFAKGRYERALEAVVTVTKEDILAGYKLNLADLNFPHIHSTRSDEVHRMVIGVRDIRWAAKTIDLGKSLRKQAFLPPNQHCLGYCAIVGKTTLYDQCGIGFK